MPLIGKMKKLKTLDLRTNVTDQGMVHLDGLDDLTWLCLNGTAITDESMEQIGKLPNLEWLIVEECEVSDAGLEHLRSHKHLTNLHLSGTAVTDMCLDTILTFENLKRLKLNRTRISDTGIRKLHNHPSLTWVELNETDVTREGLKALLDSNSNLKFHNRTEPFKSLDDDGENKKDRKMSRNNLPYRIGITGFSMGSDEEGKFLKMDLLNEQPHEYTITQAKYETEGIYSAGMGDSPQTLRPNSSLNIRFNVFAFHDLAFWIGGTRDSAKRQVYRNLAMVVMSWTPSDIWADSQSYSAKPPNKKQSESCRKLLERLEEIEGSFSKRESRQELWPAELSESDSWNHFVMINRSDKELRAGLFFRTQGDRIQRFYPGEDGAGWYDLVSDESDKNSNGRSNSISNVWQMINVARSRANKDDTYKQPLNPPATESQIKQLRSKIGLALPNQLRASLLIHDGIHESKHGRCVLFDDGGTIYPLSCDEIATIYQSNATRDAEAIEEWDTRVATHKDWIPIFSDIIAHKNIYIDVKDGSVLCELFAASDSCKAFRYASYVDFLADLLKHIENDEHFEWPEAASDQSDGQAPPASTASFATDRQTKSHPIKAQAKTELIPNVGDGDTIFSVVGSGSGPTIFKARVAAIEDATAELDKIRKDVAGRHNVKDVRFRPSTNEEIEDSRKVETIDETETHSTQWKMLGAILIDGRDH